MSLLISNLFYVGDEDFVSDFYGIEKFLPNSSIYILRSNNAISICRLIKKALLLENIKKMDFEIQDFLKITTCLDGTRRVEYTGIYNQPRDVNNFLLSSLLGFTSLTSIVLSVIGPKQLEMYLDSVDMEISERFIYSITRYRFNLSFNAFKKSCIMSIYKCDYDTHLIFFVFKYLLPRIDNICVVFNSTEPVLSLKISSDINKFVLANSVKLPFLSFVGINRHTFILFNILIQKEYRLKRTVFYLLCNTALISKHKDRNDKKKIKLENGKSHFTNKALWRNVYSMLTSF